MDFRDPHSHVFSPAAAIPPNTMYTNPFDENEHGIGLFAESFPYFSGIKMGHWSYDPANGREVWSDEIYEILGTSPELPFRSLVERFRPLHAKLRYALSEGEDSFGGTLVLTRDDGGHSRIAYQAEVKRDMDSNRPLLVLGFLQDVSGFLPIRNDTGLALTSLREEADFSHLFHSLLDSMQDGIFITDVNYIIRRVNKALEQIYPYCMPMMERPCYKVFNMDTICPNCPAEKMFKTGRRESMVHPETCYEAMEPDWLEHSSHPFIDPHTGEIVGSINVIRNITEQVKSERKIYDYSRQLEDMVDELRTAKQKADEASYAKSQFLANMSHEIRTPLSAIQGYNEFLASPNMNDEQRDEAIRVIQNNTQLLLQILNDILDFSKMEAGKMGIEIRRISVVSVLDELAVLFARQANEKGIELVFDNATPFPEMILTDSVRLTQILMNIISNAIKFTSQGGVYVTVSWQNDRANGWKDGSEKNQNERGTLQIEVRDTGIGMETAIVEQVFQPFQQADISTTRFYGGTGLGLAIVNRLVGLLDGRLELESEPNVGTRFHLYFPQPWDSDLRMLNNLDEGRSGTQASKTRIDSKIAEKLKGKRILLAEDGKDIQRLFNLILHKAGADVVLADNGLQAFEMASKMNREGKPFDLVVMDIQMPVMDGYTAVRKLRESDYTNPIIALTATIEQRDIDRCFSAGCNDYATKPIGADQIIEFVCRNLNPSDHDNL